MTTTHIEGRSKRLIRHGLISQFMVLALIASTSLAQVFMSDAIVELKQDQLISDLI